MFSSSSSRNCFNRCRSSSCRNANKLCLYDIDQEWATNKASIICVQLLTRGLGGINTGAVHTALLFETEFRCLAIEYGDSGLKVRNYSKTDDTLKIKAFESIIGKSNYVHVYDITKCFLTNLELKDVYKQINELKHVYTVTTYSYLDLNCRHFSREICLKLDCNERGLEFLSSFFLNVPFVVKSLLNAFTLGVIDLNEDRSLQDEFFVGIWALNEQKYLQRTTFTHGKKN